MESVPSAADEWDFDDGIRYQDKCILACGKTRAEVSNEQVQAFLGMERTCL